MTRLSLLLVVAAFSAVGCGDDPVSYSDPVGMSLSVASGDVDNDGGLLDEKNINTESGNPYGAFVNAAQDAIGGVPSSIVVEAATLSIDDSTGVAALEEIFAGNVDVDFVMNGSDAAYPVAARTIDVGDGAGPVDLGVRFDSGDFADVDYADLVGGSFKVVLSGDAAAGFDNASAEVDLSLVLTFTAYE